MNQQTNQQTNHPMNKNTSKNSIQRKEPCTPGTRNHLWMVLISYSLLGIFYLLTRHLTFGLHGMKSWPDLMALIALILLSLAIGFKRRILTGFVLAGHIGGYVLAMLFQRDGIDPGGGRTNNAWLIWLISFLLVSGMGLAGEIVLRRKWKNIN